jgi:hypothetical protein
MRPESVAVNQCDALPPDNAPDLKDGAGDAMYLPHPVGFENVNPNVYCLEAILQRAGAELDDMGSELAAVKFTKALDHQGFRSATLPDARDPSDRNR